MSTAATKRDLTEIAAQWREARRLYAVYSALLGRYALGLPPCRELESPVDRADPEAIRNVWNWFAQMDQRVHVHQLRQLMQTTRLGTEESLRALIQRHLAKPEKSEADRDKIDFLLVQYLSTCSPAGFYERDPSFEEVASVLEPVLASTQSSTQYPVPSTQNQGRGQDALATAGETPALQGGMAAVATYLPEWVRPLEKATKSLDELTSLRDLLENRTLDQMRKLKAGAGEAYFSPTALAAITRFNFMVRRTFVRLIAADLTAVRGALHELESRGVDQVNCLQAQLSRTESLESLKRIVEDWKKPFRAAYAAGQNFRQLVEIRTAVEKALAGGVAVDDEASAQPGTAVPHGHGQFEHVSRPGFADAPLTEDAFKGPAFAGDVASNVSTRGDSAGRELGTRNRELGPDAFAAPAFAPEPDFNLEPRVSASSWEPATGNREQSSSSDGDAEFAAALAHVRSPESASPIPVETPSSIASQLFQGAASSSAVNWEPVGDEVDDTPPPPPVARSGGVSERRRDASAPAGGTPALLDIHETATTIAQQLVGNQVKKGSVATITGEDLKLLLSSWEVDAFIAGGNEIASALQRIVAARAMLIQQLEKKKRGEPAAHVADAVRIAQAEVKSIQDKIAAAKMKKDIDAAVNMAATCKRLQTLINEAGKK